MPTIKVSFLHSLRFRMILFGVVPVVVILSLVIGYSSFAMYKDMALDVEKDLRLEAQKIAAELDLDNVKAVSVAKAMALSQRNGLFGKRRESLAFARNILEAFPEFTGAYFGYEPNADGNDAEFLEAIDNPVSAGADGNPTRVYTDHAGRFLPYVHRGEDGRVLIAPLIGMDTDDPTQPWLGMYYRGTKQAFEAMRREGRQEMAPFVTEPYDYEGVFLFEQTYPIVIDGRFRGIAGVDRSLETFNEELARFKDDRTDITVVSRLGRIVGTTVAIERATQIGSVPAPWGPLLEQMHENRTQVLLELVEHTAAGHSNRMVKSYVVAAPVSTGDWQVVLVVDHAKVFAPIWARITRVLVIAGLGLIVIVMVLLWVADTLTRRIQLAIEAARRVAAGDLSREVEVTGRDEVAVLLESFRVMTRSLNGLVGQVKHASIKLTSTATELSATSKEQEGAINAFGASTSQIAAAVKEISATGQELVQTMGEVNQVATNTAELAESGRVGLGDMDETMRQLTQSTSTISGKLSAINDKAADITMVVTTITKVADQTNLLSVNAAIEAEKAGEYGLGFLVVAREIRRLADQTGVATLDIEQMVKEMQSAVASGVMEMDRFSEQVRKVVDNVAGISGQLSQIIESVQTLTRRFEQVTEGMLSQSQGAHQINDAMLNLTQNARQTIGSLQEFNSATSGLREAIVLLKEEIERFRLGDK